MPNPPPTGPSSLIKRIVDPASLTQDEKDAIDTHLGGPLEDYKLSVHGTIGVAQEIIEGRLVRDILSQFLTDAERVDAEHIIDNVIPILLTLDKIERLLFLGELGNIYTHGQIETILGLT